MTNQWLRILVPATLTLSHLFVVDAVGSQHDIEAIAPARRQRFQIRSPFESLGGHLSFQSCRVLLRILLHQRDHFGQICEHGIPPEGSETSVQFEETDLRLIMKE